MEFWGYWGYAGSKEHAKQGLEGVLTSFGKFCLVEKKKNLIEKTSLYKSIEGHPLYEFYRGAPSL